MGSFSIVDMEVFFKFNRSFCDKSHNQIIDHRHYVFLRPVFYSVLTVALKAEGGPRALSLIPPLLLITRYAPSERECNFEPRTIRCYCDDIVKTIFFCIFQFSKFKLLLCRNFFQSSIKLYRQRLWIRKCLKGG